MSRVATGEGLTRFVISREDQFFSGFPVTRPWADAVDGAYLYPRLEMAEMDAGMLRLCPPSTDQRRIVVERVELEVVWAGEAESGLFVDKAKE